MSETISQTREQKLSTTPVDQTDAPDATMMMVPESLETANEEAPMEEVTAPPTTTTRKSNEPGGFSYASIVSGNSAAGSESTPSLPVQSTQQPPSPAPVLPEDLQAAADFLSPEELESIRLALEETDVVGTTADADDAQFPALSRAGPPKKSKSKPPKRSGLSKEEMEQIQQALAASEQDVSAVSSPAAAAAAAANPYAESGLSSEEQEAIERALREADEAEQATSTMNAAQTNLKDDGDDLARIEEQEDSKIPAADSKPPAAGIASTGEDDKDDFDTTIPASTATNELGISAEEQAAIDKAIREADAAEEALSLQLAMRMQQEEERHQQHRQKESFPPLSSEPYNKVRTLTRAELYAEQKSNQDVYMDTTLPSRTDDLDTSGAGVYAAGFRMNSIVEHEWSRHDADLVVGPNNEIRTKHDITLDSEANAHRLGLSADYDASRVGSRAFNSFRQNMKRQTKKGVTTQGTGRAGSDSDGTKAGAMDAAAVGHINKAVNSGLINRMNGVVKEGKEAVIYHGDEGEESGGFDVAVKVFKRIQEFKGRGDYVDGDPRFETSFKNSSKRQQLELWTEKEYRNLIRANRAKVPVPTPLMYKDNILFMRFLGIDGWPAPQLRELDLRKGSKKWKILYTQVMEAMHLLYTGGRLVHGDLSEYNIMVVPAYLVENLHSSIEDPKNDLQAVLIDFGQAVDIRHPESRSLLERDVDRVTSFFRRQGVETKSLSEEVALVMEGKASESSETQESTVATIDPPS